MSENQGHPPQRRRPVAGDPGHGAPAVAETDASRQWLIEVCSFPPLLSQGWGTHGRAAIGVEKGNSRFVRLLGRVVSVCGGGRGRPGCRAIRSEEHTSELQSLRHLVCRLL